MLPAKSISVIIPAYNEESRIGKTLEQLTGNMKHLKEIIVVTDGTDNTGSICSSFGNNIKVLQYKKRLGKGGAIMEGFKVAEGDVLTFVDADGAIPWYEVERLSMMVDKRTPCVVGSRWAQNSKVTKYQPRVRVFLGSAYRHLTNLMLNLNVKDIQCGLKCFEKNLAKQLIPRIFLKDWSFDTSLIYNVSLMGRNIVEEGIEWADMPNSKLKIFKVVPMMFAYVIGLKIVHSRFGPGFHFAFQKLSNIFSAV